MKKFDKTLFFFFQLTFLPRLGSVNVRKMLQIYHNPEELLHALRNQNFEDLRTTKVKWTHAEFAEAEKLANQELELCAKLGIEPISILDDKYPELLKQCQDAPVVLFSKGVMDWKPIIPVAIVGTRSQTQYGKSCIEELIAGLKGQPICIVSGLALGCDATAHKAALENGLPTAAVFAHGVDKVYPKKNKPLADEILENGGWLSEFPSFVPPEKTNFLIRNRIVAGLSRAIVVVESDIRGGSMSTATFAQGYNRDVFAFPGRINDRWSRGCNHLIASQKAAIIRNAQDLIDGLNLKPKASKTTQKELFVHLEPQEQQIVDMLRQHQRLSVDQLASLLNLGTFKLLPILLELEIKDVVRALPGKFFELK